MQDIKDITSLLDTVRNKPKKSKLTLISKGEIKKWMLSKNIEVLGALFTLLMYHSRSLQVNPYLTVEDYNDFIMYYFLRCIKENPEGEEVISRYEAGRTFVNWFNHIWNDIEQSQPLLSRLKQWLVNLYKDGDEEIRICIITAILEHLFENKEIAEYFIDWRKDQVLKEAYDEALGYSNIITSKSRLES